MRLCPPPEDLVLPSIVTKIQEKAERVAQQLGLSGLANLEGYINAETGEVKVIDIDTAPALHLASPIFAQVSSHTSALQLSLAVLMHDS